MRHWWADTLFKRLFLLMWFGLVASHLLAFMVTTRVMHAAPPAALSSGAPGGPGLPVLPSLPPMGIGPQAEGRGGPPPQLRDLPLGGPPPGPPPRFPEDGGLPASALWLDYGIRFFAIGIVAWFGARWLSAPMRRLATASEGLGSALGQSPARPPLDEAHGTLEVRQTAQVFNTMARRLHSQFDAQRLLMAAISHDLRTPLARLRLRLEAMPAPAETARCIADIHEMNTLVGSVLEMLREQHAEGDMPNARIEPAHDHDHGLAHDLRALSRRRALRWIGAAGALPLIGCGGGGDSVATIGTTTTTTTTASGCAVMPTETNGPYPADGTGSLNALLLSGIVRSDIRSSFAGATAVAAGVPLTMTLNLVNANASCASLAGYAIYIWHCDRAGRYSLYSSGVTGENYLRGVQVTDANGQVTFTTIFPACYDGRWPHIHVEIYPSLARATNVSNVNKTTQIAMTAAPCYEVFASDGYSASVANFNRVSIASDNVFSDGATLETPTITGSVAAGYQLALTMAVAG